MAFYLFGLAFFMVNGYWLCLIIFFCAEVDVWGHVWGQVERGMMLRGMMGRECNGRGGVIEGEHDGGA